jgi:hypothetical protein
MNSKIHMFSVPFEKAKKGLVSQKDKQILFFFPKPRERVCASTISMENTQNTTHFLLFLSQTHTSGSSTDCTVCTSSTFPVTDTKTKTIPPSNLFFLLHQNTSNIYD